MATTYSGPFIGKRVAAYRRLNGWSMDDLAGRTGGELGKSVIANLETGRKHDVTVAQLITLASALGVYPIALLVDLEDFVHSDLSGLRDTVGWLSGMQGRQMGPADLTPAARAVQPVFDDFRQMRTRIDNHETTVWLTQEVAEDGDRLDWDRVTEQSLFEVARARSALAESAAKLAAALAKGKGGDATDVVFTDAVDLHEAFGRRRGKTADSAE